MSAVMQGAPEGMRPMNEDDLAQVLSIEESIYSFPWTRGIFRDCLFVGYSCWVYEKDEQVIAYSILSIAADEAHILTVVVAPEHQGKGVGRMMMTFMMDVARTRFVDKVFLEVRPSNERAIALYTSMGFKEVGVRPGYYPAEGGREDAIVLSIEF